MANLFDGPNPFQSPEIIQAELNEPKQSKGPPGLRNLPAGTCACLIVFGFLTLFGWRECLRSRDEILFALTAAGTILSLVLSLRMIRWAVGGV